MSTTVVEPSGQAPQAPRNVLGRVDRWQRRHSPIAFVVAVWKKFGDDQGGKLVGQLTYRGFLSLFPLLLVTVTILGYVLDGRPDLQRDIVDSAVSQFPVIGDQLRQNVESLNGNIWALLIGAGTALWGGLGVTQASQDVLAAVWNIPRRHRPGFLPRLLRGVLLLAVLALAVVSTASLTSLATALDGLGDAGRVGLIAASLALNVCWFALAFRTLTPKGPSWRELLPGAVVAAVGFQILLVLGTTIVDRQLSGATSSYGLFGVVLGLLAWIALLATVFVYAAEVNPVRARHLWPRSIFTPGLTEPDRAVLDAEVVAELRAPQQSVSISYDNQADAESGNRPTAGSEHRSTEESRSV
jgi:inner membrane protein YhjD